jgi:hypothetical protein
MFMKYSISKSEKGSALIEVLTSITISVIIAVGAIWALISFFNKYEEFKLRTYLYQESFNALSQIKFGIPLGSGEDTYFYGVNSANKLRITRGFSNTEGRGLRVIPSVRIGGYFDFAEYYFDGSQIKATYQYQSITPPAPIILFPAKHQDKIFVTDFQVKMLNDPNSGKDPLNPGLCVRVSLSAELRYKGKIHPMSYETIMTVIKVKDTDYSDSDQTNNGNQ